MIAHRALRAHGRVQGVYYRQGARREAERLGIVGYAGNEADGTVLLEVEGEPDALDRFVAWCRVGPPRARVERVEEEVGAVVGFAEFRTF